jgi:hypothetical protein
MTGETDSHEVSRGRVPVRMGRLRQPWLVVIAGLAAIPVLAACSSAPGHAASGQGVAAVSAVCSQVGAALSDGPDPGADPVGYAEAQIHPLRAISTSDPALRVAIRDLAAAYASVFAHDGKDQSATKAVSEASKKVNAICPGAAS